MNCDELADIIMKDADFYNSNGGELPFGWRNAYAVGDF